jgi:arsenite/tail-anchored protein-transporting ATPase
MTQYPARTVLMTGKGGVGKTTLSAAAAVTAADRGSRTLLVSTDAAHSLSDVVGMAIGPTPTPIVANLAGLQIDARHELQESWSTIAHYLKRVFGIAEVDQLRLDELVVVPGLDQLVALTRLRALALSGEWEAIIVDCAPSADSLRLLSLPEVLQWYSERLFGRGSAFGKWGRRRIERSLAVPLPDAAVMDSIEEMSGELRQLRTVLNSEKTTARVVLTPERVVIAEAQRTLSYLALYGHTVDAIVVNRVPSGESRAANLRMISDSFAGLPILKVPHRPDEPIGLAQLRDVGSELYGDLNPLAKFVETPALDIASDGQESVLRLLVPGASRDELDIEMDGSDLIVSLGSYRRLVKLPDGLIGRPVARAGLRGQYLEIVFGV